MGCPSLVEIGDNLVFSITSHDPDTGVLTDAESAPTYRVYEDETATAILTGSMAKLDDSNTTGFYTESIACTAANGFEDGKTYTVYIEATVDGDTGGICYGFKAITPFATQMNAQVLAVLNTTTFAEPGQGNPGATISLAQKLGYLYKAWRNPNTRTSTYQNVYNDDAETIDHKATLTDNGTTFTKGKFGTGP